MYNLSYILRFIKPIIIINEYYSLSMFITSSRKDRPRKEKETRKYKSHPQTISTNVKINFPKNDNELQKLLTKCNTANKKLRVTGGSYSAAHIVMSEYENDEVMLISLKKYSNKTFDFIIDTKENTMTVNAGYTIFKTYKKINDFLKPLPHQRYSQSYEFNGNIPNSKYTIGGIVASPTNGGKIDTGFFYDDIIKIRILNANGSFEWIDGDDLRFHKGGMGGFGIITHAIIRIYESKNIILRSSEMLVGITGCCVEQRRQDIPQAYLKKFLKNIIQKSLYTQFVFDMYTNHLVSYGWIDATLPSTTLFNTETDLNGDEKPPAFTESEYSSRLEGVPKLRLHKAQRSTRVNCNFRRSKIGMKAICALNMWNIEQNIINTYLKNDQNGNYGWDEYHPHSLYMTYYIPVDKDFINVYKALTVVHNATKLLISDSHYCPDMPIMFQFLQSSKFSMFSPTKEGQMYMSITLQSMTFTIQQDGDNELCTAWRNYFHIIEHGWKELGGKPDLSGLHSFQDNEIFSDILMKSLLSDKEKRKIIAYKSATGSSVFSNMYLEQLLE